MIETYYHHKSINRVIIGMLAAVLLIPCLVIVSTDNYFGFALLGLWVSLFTIRKGVKIDYQKKEILFFREYLWMRFYNYKNFQNYSFYRMKRTSESYSLNSKVQTMQISNEFHVIEFLNNRKNIFERIAIGNLNTISAIAQKVEKDLGIERMKKSPNKIQ